MGQVSLHLLGPVQLGSAPGGLVPDGGPAGLHLLQPPSHRGADLGPAPAQGPALLPGPGGLLLDQDQVPLKGHRTDEVDSTCTQVQL